MAVTTRFDVSAELTVNTPRSAAPCAASTVSGTKVVPRKLRPGPGAESPPAPEGDRTAPAVLRARTAISRGNHAPAHFARAAALDRRARPKFSYRRGAARGTGHLPVVQTRLRVVSRPSANQAGRPDGCPVGPARVGPGACAGYWPRGRRPTLRPPPPGRRRTTRERCRRAFSWPRPSRSARLQRHHWHRRFRDPRSTGNTLPASRAEPGRRSAGRPRGVGPGPCSLPPSFGAVPTPPTRCRQLFPASATDFELGRPARRQGWAGQDGRGRWRWRAGGCPGLGLPVSGRGATKRRTRRATGVTRRR